MPRYGIDTSIFVRLLTGDSQQDFEETKAGLEVLLARDPTAEIEVSNMVIAEAYFVLQHHYGVPKDEAKAALVAVMTSGLLKPKCGHPILRAWEAKEEPGLLDRLIAADYASNGIVTVTHDYKMGRLPGARLL